MITELRAADPAADLNPSSTSPAAEAMLQQVLAAPRVEARTHRPRRRLAYGLVAAAALAAGTAVLTGLPGSAPDAQASGYTVARHADGSVEVSIEFADFRDPAALQRSLRAQDVRAVVLSGDMAYEQGTPLPPRPACAKYRSMSWGDDGVTSDDPFEFRFQGPRGARLIVHPAALPADGTYVFEVDSRGERVRAFSVGVALGRTPTCVG